MNTPATSQEIKALKAGESYFNAYPNRAARRRGDVSTGPAIEQVVYTKADIRSAQGVARAISDGRLITAPELEDRMANPDTTFTERVLLGQLPVLSEERTERLYDVIKYAEQEREQNRTRRQMVRHYANPKNRNSHNKEHHNGLWNGAGKRPVLPATKKATLGRLMNILKGGF